jgi:hypothetical protein
VKERDYSEGPGPGKEWMIILKWILKYGYGFDLSGSG